MDVSDWVSAALTVAAVIASALIVRPTILSAQAAHEALRHSIEQSDLERDERLRRDALALDVYWGYDRVNPLDHEPFLLMITNRSSQAVYRAAVSDGDTDKVFETRMVPPGSWRSRLRARPGEDASDFRQVKPADPQTFSLADRAAYAVTAYEFTDGAGRRWGWTERDGVQALSA
jgi:hypothetical protein